MRPPRAPPLALIAAAALGGCAAVPSGPPPPSPEEALGGLKSLALVHRLGPSEGAERRRRDPLDALQDALSARGMATLAIDLPESPPVELAAVDAAVRQAEFLAPTGRPDSGLGPVGSIGERAARALAQVGADALVVFVRGPTWGPQSEPLPMLGRPRSMEPPAAPTSAFGIVARDGTVFAVAWGGRGQPWSDAPANAAEAVELLLPVLLGAPAE